MLPDLLKTLCQHEYKYAREVGEGNSHLKGNANLVVV